MPVVGLRRRGAFAALFTVCRRLAPPTSAVLRRALPALTSGLAGRQDQHIELLFYKLDTNHDGVIDLDEFVDGYSQYMSLVTTGQFLTVTRELTPKLFLKTEEPIPSGATLVENWNAGKIKLYKHTYPANDPSEDRSTLVVGDDFLFCGVWDGAQRRFEVAG